MPALNLLQPVPHRLQEIVIGLQDGSVERELDDGLHAMQRGHLRFQLGAVGHRLLCAGALLWRQYAKQRTPRRPTVCSSAGACAPAVKPGMSIV